jgi:hypothetical protein
MTDKSFSVLIAKQEHIELVLPLVLLSLKETGLFEVNESKVRNYVINALLGRGSICGIVLGNDKSVQGFVLLDISETWYSNEKVLAEREVFVHPDFRGSKGGRARALCELAKKIANSLSIPLYVGLESEGKTDAKVRLYERQFGKPTGSLFLYGAGHLKPRDAVEH